MLLWLLYLHSVVASSIRGLDGGTDCIAFSSNGLAASFYQYYRFYDFRNISDVNDQTERKPLHASSNQRNKTVSGGSWVNDWYIRDYPRASPGPRVIPVDFIPSRVYISKSTDNSSYYETYLTLSTARIGEQIQEAGEITFREFNVSHASIRVFARVRGQPGAVAGIFTYLNDTEESDIEIFTRSPADCVQYSNQPTSSGEPDWIPIPGASVNDTMPNNWEYTTWHVHRLDWTPGRSVFFVDDIQTNTTTLHVPIAQPPSGIYIDMWSANSSSSGSMQIGHSAELNIQWIELLFNTTDSKGSSEVSGGAVCPVGIIDREADQQSSKAHRISGSYYIVVLSIAVVIYINL